MHAVQQVIAFHCAAVRSEQSWVRGTNARLPDTIALRWARPVSADFDPRRDARARSYRYLLLDAPVRSPLWQGRAGWTHRRLDTGRMHDAAQSLCGQHDFSSFRSSQCQARDPVRLMHSLKVRRHGAFVIVDLRANAFLHHMVRNIVGALLLVGDGRRPPDWVATLLDARDRKQGAPTFDAAGLYFLGPEYAPETGLPPPATASGIEIPV